MKNITFVVGLPCSGKSHLAKKLFAEQDSWQHKCLVMDDFIQPEELEFSLQLDQHLILSDPFFCDAKIRCKAIDICNNYSEYVNFHFYFFENSLQKAMNNMNHRKKQGDDRKVEQFIKDLHKIYDVPNYGIVKAFDAPQLTKKKYTFLPIWQPGEP